MTPDEERAIDVVVRNKKDKDPVNLSVKHRLTGFDGTIYFVRWTSRTEGRDHETISYFPAGSEDGIFLWHGEDAIRHFSRLQPVSQAEKLVRSIFGLAGISGIIALLITTTICYMVLKGATDVPAILANALTTILGFFFGSQVVKAKN